MKSILENRSALAKEVDKVAEVAGYLWQKGWAERNGGNITINITEFVDDEIRRMQPISEVRSIGANASILQANRGSSTSLFPPSLYPEAVYSHCSHSSWYSDTS